MKKHLIIADESGAVAIVVAIMLSALLAMAAFAIDIGHLMVVRNELRNAADAGALAGARQLYSAASTSTVLAINTGANTVASLAATANWSDGSSVEAPSSTIQRGHWCFFCPSPTGGLGAFTANESVTSYALSSFDFATLDADPNFINAVRVVASRGSAASFFAGILGPAFSSFSLSADSVAWRGFTGGGFPAEAPIAICKDKIYINGAYNCENGVMSNSAGSETAAWTNLTQDPMTPSSAKSIKDLLSNDAALASQPINLGDMSTVGGVAYSVFDTFYNIWAPKTGKTELLKLTVPMIECNGKNPGPSNEVVGAVTVEIYWMTENGNDPQFTKIPTEFNVNPDTAAKEYTCPATCSTEPCASLATTTGRQLCWQNFMNSFKDSEHQMDLSTAVSLYVPASFFFKPSCDISSLGTSGGPPGALLAKYPRLVH